MIGDIVDTILMCKNAPVYNITTEQVYTANLLPGLMLRNPCNLTFKLWFSTRYSSNTNTIARSLKGITFGQGKRPTINRETHALSLTDCYWIKQANDKVIFEQCSPYYKAFWTGQGIYSGGPIPTLYVGGYLNKEWVNSRILCKYGEETLRELECTMLCRECGIRAVKISPLPNNMVGIQVENITNTEFMLEQADQSGRLDPDDFDEYKIEELFGLDGIKMMLIDAIVGNGDRHAGNFGWLRNTVTGQYVCMAPVYDFDHAFDSMAKSDRLISDTIKIVETKQEYIAQAMRICKITIRSNINNIFNLRASTILNTLTGS